MMSRDRAQLPRLRHPLVRPRHRPSGHRARDRPGDGPHPAGHDHRLRRQPHQHARRVRRHRLRHRHQPGARRARLAVPGDQEAEGAPHRGQRHAAAGRLRQGRDPAHHPHARREGRRRLRLRVRRRGARPHDDGRAHDRLQHEHRGRRALRLRQSRSRRPSTICAAARSRRRATAFERAVAWWTSMASDAGAAYDDVDPARRRRASRRS